MNKPLPKEPVRATPPIAVPAVFLVGFMGAGKSTVGPILAERLRCRFIDLDERIVSQTSRAIADIFTQEGEAAFRKLESDALLQVISEVLGGAHAVVALGGGAYAQRNNVAAIAQTGLPVVFLDASVDELRARCAAGGDTRPLFRDEKRFRELYEERRSCYLQGSVRIDTNGKSVEDSTEEILQILARHKRGQGE